MTNTNYNNPEELERVTIAQEIEKLRRENRKLMAGKIASYVLAGVSVAAAIYCGKKLKDVMGVINSAVTDVSSLTYIDVQQAIVDKAVDKAAQNAAGKAVKATEGLMTTMVERAVSNAVVNAKEPLKQAVTEKMAREIAMIDKSELVEAVEEQAKTMILEKFEGRLDGIASDFSRNLENVGKIYQSIAETMQQKTL